MPVDDIFWDLGIGADFHLVPGLSSPRLDQLLSIIFDGNLMRADAPPPGVAVTFVTTFVPGSSGNERRGDSDAARPARSPSQARCRRTRGCSTSSWSPSSWTARTTPFSAYIRFHIHAGLTQDVAHARAAHRATGRAATSASRCSPSSPTEPTATCPTGRPGASPAPRTAPSSTFQEPTRSRW